MVLSLSLSSSLPLTIFIHIITPLLPPSSVSHLSSSLPSYSSPSSSSSSAVSHPLPVLADLRGGQRGPKMLDPGAAGGGPDKVPVDHRPRGVRQRGSQHLRHHLHHRAREPAYPDALHPAIPSQVQLHPRDLHCTRRVSQGDGKRRARWGGTYREMLRDGQGRKEEFEGNEYVVLE